MKTERMKKLRKMLKNRYSEKLRGGDFYAAKICLLLLSTGSVVLGFSDEEWDFEQFLEGNGMRGTLSGHSGYKSFRLKGE